MVNQYTFSSYHPLVNFLYFALVLVFAMCFMHPVSLVISLGSGIKSAYTNPVLTGSFPPIAVLKREEQWMTNAIHHNAMFTTKPKPAERKSRRLQSLRLNPGESNLGPRKKRECKK